MNSDSIILIGGPDSGKTNFLGRLWKALQSGICRLKAVESPEIKYVEDALAHLLSGAFAPRTEQSLDDHAKTLIVTVGRQEGEGRLSITVPDVTGELWNNAVNTSELPIEWMEQLKAASGALLFVRVHSDLNVSPLDWVTARELLSLEWADGAGESGKLPTQVVLCELLRFLELTLKSGPHGSKPRVGVAVTAWDRLDNETKRKGPRAFLESEYPLFSGRIEDTEKVEVRAFGISVVGGDLTSDDAFRNSFFVNDFDATGYVVVDSDIGPVEESDLTTPIAWLAHE